MARILFFGKLRDAAGGASREYAIGEGVTITSLKDRLSAEDDVLGTALNVPSVRCIVNEEIVQGDAQVKDSDEIAFIPPVSGG